jgi:hypothetical protein
MQLMNEDGKLEVLLRTRCWLNAIFKSYLGNRLFFMSRVQLIRRSGAVTALLHSRSSKLKENSWYPVFAGTIAAASIEKLISDELWRHLQSTTAKNGVWLHRCSRDLVVDVWKSPERSGLNEWR